MTLSDDDIDALASGLGPLLDPPEEEADLALLMAWRAGELDEVETARAEVMLAADPAARAFIDEFEDAPSAFVQAWAVKHGTRAVRPPKRWIAPTVTLLSLAAAVAFFVMRPTVDPPPGYAVFDVVGAQKLVRGDESPLRGPSVGGPYRVDNEATVTVILKPGEDLDAKADAAITARAFVDEGGKLELSKAQGQFGAGGAWTLEAPITRILGDRLGQRSLHVAFAFDEAQLQGLAGESLPTSEDEGGVRWHAVEFDYVDRKEGSE